MKNVQLAVTFTLFVEVPDDWNEEQARFFYEKNYCVKNHISQLGAEYDANPGVCVHCATTQVKVVGIVSPSKESN